MMTATATDRFSRRADYYARSRPGYPDEVVEVLGRDAGWTPQSVVADIGAGTGISSELFLRHGNTVFGVEPNSDMRAAAERLALQYPGYRVINATAENTGLGDASVDFVVAATAFHWFDSVQAKAEFRRILRPGGCVVLLWNRRIASASPFLSAYEQLLRAYGTDYQERWGTERENLQDRVFEFFGTSACHKHVINNPQELDYDGLTARVLSSSYTPLPGDENYEPMIGALRGLFAQCQEGGVVTMLYETCLYWGRPGE